MRISIIARLRKALSDMRSLQPGFRASRLYGRALNLEKRGKDREAFVVLTNALALLPDHIEQHSVAMPVTLSTVLVMTAHYAQLASRLGTPHAAHDAIRRALQLAVPYEHEPTTREYTTWLRSQIE